MACRQIAVSLHYRADGSSLWPSGQPVDQTPQRCRALGLVAPVSRLDLELVDNRPELAADQFDRVGVAVQEVLGHHPLAARLVQCVQALGGFLDRADDAALVLFGEKALAVVAFALPLRQAGCTVDDLGAGLADDPAGQYRERQRPRVAILAFTGGVEAPSQVGDFVDP